MSSLIAALLCSLTVYVGRWWSLAHIVGINVTLAAAFATGFRGLFLSLALPGSIGIDGTRLLYLKEHHGDHMAAGLASVVMDRFTGYIGLLILGALASLSLMLNGSGEIAQTLFLVNFALLLGMLILILGAMGVFPVPGLNRLTRFAPVARTLGAFREYENHKMALLLSIGLACLSHCFVCLAWYLSIVSLGELPSVGQVIATTSILTIVRTIPITPLGLGVTDGLAEAIYRLFAITTGAEAQMLIRIVNSLILVLSGLAFLKTTGKLDPGKRKC